MDKTTSTIVLTIATVEWILAVVTNLTVLYLIIRGTPKEYKNFSLLLSVMSCVQLLTSTLGWTTLSRVAQSPGGIVFVIFGFGSVFGSKPCFVLDQISLSLTNYGLLLVPFAMIYRFYSFCYKSLKRRYLGLLLFFLGAPWIYLQKHLLQQYVSPRELESDRGFGKDLSGYVYYGIKFVPGWETTWVQLTTYLPVSCFILTLVVRQLFLCRLPKISALHSEKTRMLHRNLAMMLLVQSAIPLSYTANNILTSFILSAHTTVSPLFSSLAYILNSVGPSADAIAILLFVPLYRDTLKRWLCCGPRTVDAEATAASKR